MLFVHLFLEFFKIGVFSVGGGYATLPFLYHIAEVYQWYTPTELAQMIALSSITPGPVGINVATFAGFKTGGILGSVIATFSLVLPSYIFVVFVSKLLKKFKESFWVQAVLYSLKPTGCALLASVAVGLFQNNVIDLKALLVFVCLFLMTFKFKRNALLYFVVAGCFGIIKYFLA